MGTIYFIRAEKGPIKIGFTMQSPRKRMKDLQTSNPRKLYLLATARGTKRDEHTLHTMFKDYRLQGEWFEASPEILQYIFHSMTPAPAAHIVHAYIIRCSCGAILKSTKGKSNNEIIVQTCDTCLAKTNNITKYPLDYDRLDERLVKGALKVSGGNQSQAAELLNITRARFRTKLKQFKI